MNDKIRFSPMPGQVLGHVDNFGGDSDDPAGFGEPVESVTDIDAANVITSKVNHIFGHQRHKVMVDVDMPCKVVPSTTPGHFHLYIDREMSWHDYKLLLGTFERVGIISPGYHDASILRGFTTLRLPWIKKKSPADSEYPPRPAAVPGFENPDCTGYVKNYRGGADTNWEAVRCVKVGSCWTNGWQHLSTEEIDARYLNRGPESKRLVAEERANMALRRGVEETGPAGWAHDEGMRSF